MGEGSRSIDMMHIDDEKPWPQTVRLRSLRNNINMFGSDCLVSDRSAAKLYPAKVMLDESTDYDDLVCTNSDISPYLFPIYIKPAEELFPRRLSPSPG